MPCFIELFDGEKSLRLNIKKYFACDSDERSYIYSSKNKVEMQLVHNSS